MHVELTYMDNKNKLKFNDLKTEVLMQSLQLIFQIYVSELVLVLLNKSIILSVIFDEHLNFNAHHVLIIVVRYYIVCMILLLTAHTIFKIRQLLYLF